MIGMYVQSLFRLNLIVLFLLLIRKLIGSRLRKKFIYGLWIVVPVFLLSFPFVKLPQLFHLNLHMNLQFGQLQMKEGKVVSEEAEDAVVIRQGITDDLGGEVLQKSGSWNENGTNKNAANGNAVNENIGNENALNAKVASADAVNENIGNENALNAKTASANALNEKIISENTVHDNAVNENTVNENTINENSVNGNTVNGMQHSGQKEDQQANFADAQAQTESTGDIQKSEQMRNVLVVVASLYLSIVVGIMLTILDDNLRLLNSCKKKRKYLFQSEAGLPVYHIDGISTPFIIGRSIYLPSFITGEEQIKYAVLHEESHYRHGDSFWVIVRYAVLAIYFFDPIIWWAFFASGNDCELACDEEVLERIGAEERKAYGACLLEIAEQKQGKAGRMVFTTNMSTGKRLIKKRILSIVDSKKKSRLMMALAATLLLLVTGCVYERQSEAIADQENPTSQAEEVKEPTNETAKIGAKEEALSGTKQTAKEPNVIVNANVSNDREKMAEIADVSASNGGEEHSELTNSEAFEPDMIEASEITTEDLIVVANSIGEFESISDISPERMILALLNVVDYKILKDPELVDMFADESHPNSFNELKVDYEVLEYDAEQIKKAAKAIFDVDLTEYLESIKTTGIKGETPLKCKNGKFYELHDETSKKYKAIRNISKIGDTYTFYKYRTPLEIVKSIPSYVTHTLYEDCRMQLVSYLYDPEYSKYEAVIQNGVIKSVKFCWQRTEEERKAQEEKAEKLRRSIPVDKKDRDRLNIAYYLLKGYGDFTSVSSIPKEVVLSAIVYDTASLAYRDTAEDISRDEAIVFSCTEEEVRQIANEYLNLDLSQRIEDYRNIKYHNGKYLARNYSTGFSYNNDERTEWWTPFGDLYIDDVRKDGDIYVFHTSSVSILNEYRFFYLLYTAEEHEYEVVIKDGVIVSGKQVY